MSNTTFPLNQIVLRVTGNGAICLDQTSQEYVELGDSFALSAQLIQVQLQPNDALSNDIVADTRVVVRKIDFSNAILISN